MKKILITLLMMLWLTLPALAEEALPQGVRLLCETKYPAYIIAAHDGWGDEIRGQYALVLTDGEDNILCIAEKRETDSAYAFTVDNTNALREGAEIPSLLIDTGGDSLFYSYWDDGLYKTSYHIVKQNDEWGRVSLNYIDTSYTDHDVDVWVGVDGNCLFYDVRTYDKLENQIANLSDNYMDIPVSAEFAKNLTLATFDIGMLSPEPGLIKPYPGLCAPLLEEGDELISLNVQQDNLIMLVKKPDNTKRIRITDGWDEYKNDYIVEETGPVPEDAYIDTWHGSARTTLHLCAYGGDIFNFSQMSDDKWYFTSVQSSDSFGILYDGVENWEESSVYRNDHVTYGVSPWNSDIMQLDLLNLPRSYDEAISQLDASNYMFVNNPNPNDRLHLRTKPQKGAQSLGKFYNRTPVYVIEEKGDWAHVRIGNETDGLEGYMMAKFLTRGSVACAFPQKHVLPEVYSETGFSLKAKPQKDAEEVCTVTASWNIIGVVEDDWYVIMTGDGMVGYALQNAFYDGNG